MMVRAHSIRVLTRPIYTNPLDGYLVEEWGTVNTRRWQKNNEHQITTKKVEKHQHRNLTFVLQFLNNLKNFLEKGKHPHIQILTVTLQGQVSQMCQTTINHNIAKDPQVIFFTKHCSFKVKKHHTPYDTARPQNGILFTVIPHRKKKLLHHKSPCPPRCA